MMKVFLVILSLFFISSSADEVTAGLVKNHYEMKMRSLNRLLQVSVSEGCESGLQDLALDPTNFIAMGKKFIDLLTEVGSCNSFECIIDASKYIQLKHEMWTLIDLTHLSLGQIF